MIEKATNQPESNLSPKLDQNTSETLLKILLEKVIEQLPISISELMYRQEDKISTIIHQSTTSINQKLNEIKYDVKKLERHPQTLSEEQLSEWLNQLEKRFNEKLKRQEYELNKLREKVESLEDQVTELSIINEAILYRNNKKFSQHSPIESLTNSNNREQEISSDNILDFKESKEYSSISNETKKSVEDYPLSVGEVARKWDYSQAAICFHLRKNKRFRPKDSTIEYEGMKPSDGAQGKKWRLRLVKK
ncbi:hypothetical protein [Lyngbya sp. PCC 8106]|uniref:hypothetical protein n=1 Tax=Lyngbya sp. (strain PCC 8106) TaxID=313612 RepID=UPI0000EAB623|nr:hypothetical protein [Lyngbya sp. PCC 8106]EAW36041.1 hypothetical protein L8106_22636 [Lyngbya sp. PCC 8106]